MPRGILDASTLILLGRLQDTDPLPDEPLITAITLAELSVGLLLASTDQERSARQAHLKQAEADFDPLPFDAAVSYSATLESRSPTQQPSANPGQGT